VAYANPAYGIRHAAAEAGFAKITTKYATAAGFGKERLIDYRGALLMKFAASQADHDVEIDRGTGLLEALDRLAIPPGHNLSGVDLEIYGGATSPAATLLAETVVALSSLWVDFAFPASSDRYLRLKFNTTGTWELGELWFTRYLQPATGIVRDWEAPLLTPRQVVEFPSREAVALLATPRRRMQLEHQGLAEAGADEQIYRLLASSGVALPFLFWGMDTAAIPFVARLEEDLEKTQDHPQPKTQVAYTYKLALREQLL